ncbi:NAD(P)/FAD-dependent oxidoreductase [Parasynechococcus sp.]|uniref:NAD(P)/FAD-dependent oxidoreductase n=1 Tax=Parasynechococcus sp. TaxID=3101203 RepID=UPI003703C8C6
MTARGQRASAIATTGSPLSSAPISQSVPLWDLLVVGGGAAGFMAAITAAESGVKRVLVLEATPDPLTKVRLSGGGRCNVTHACWDPAELVGHYPRGQRPLRGPFSRFAAGDAIAWFADHGLNLVEEPDGRMFPEANRSSAVVQCLRQSARDHGVALKLTAMAQRVEHQPDGCFHVHCRGGEMVQAKRLLLATGGHPSGRRLAQSLGHQLIAPVPSLFTLALDAPELVSCSGVALDDVALTLQLEGQRFHQVGRVLITHWGLSGPALLRLTAFAARALHGQRYRGELKVRWCGAQDQATLAKSMRDLRQTSARRTLAAARPLVDRLPRRLWLALLQRAGVNPELRWADCPAKFEQALLRSLQESVYSVKGRGPFGEEFVTAGGVTLGEVNLATMESRVCPGLHLAGELLDIDGVTGGFNFQHCWTSGWLAGQAVAEEITRSDRRS